MDRCDKMRDVTDFTDFLRRSNDPKSFINDFHSLKPQVDFLKDASGKFAMNFVGHFEYLEEDLKSICRELGFEVKLPHLNSTKKSIDAYKSAYTEELISIIAERFAEDISLFGYNFDQVHSTQRNRKNRL